MQSNFGNALYIKASNFLTVVNPGVNRKTKWCPLGSSSDMAENFGATIRFPKGFKDTPLTHINTCHIEVCTLCQSQSK